MSKMGGIIVVLLSLVMGFAGGFTYEATMGAKKAASKSSSTSSTDSKQSLADCLKETWGEDKYAAISANSSLATTEDNLAALKCYE